MGQLSKRIIYQPLHPSVRPLLDPQYVTYHDSCLQYLPPDDTGPWDPSFRHRTPMATTHPVAVGSTRDVVLPNKTTRVRAFSPPLDQKPHAGWPILVWLHGGGWVAGGLESENDLCSLMCNTASCVVLTVEYRLAPENPYPAAIEDAADALAWVASDHGSIELGIDTSRIAVGGTSAGGNLCAALSLRAALLPTPISLVFQLLLVPVIDNSANALSSTWAAHVHAPWLTPARMLWYRKLYLPNAADRVRWSASPNLAPKELLSKSPPTWIAVAGEDLLRCEAEDYARLLANAGVDVEVESYDGVGHSILALCDILDQGKRLMRDAADVLRLNFTKYGVDARR